MSSSSSTTRAHSHKCKACGNTYEHTHNFKVADHPQDDYQCPYEDCTMFFENGKSKYQDRKPRKIDAQPTQPKDDASLSPPSKQETKLAKDVRIGFSSGKLECANLAHYKSGKDPVNPRFSCAVPLAPPAIIERMTPFKIADCQCERNACKAAWAWNKAGVFDNQWVSPGAYFKGITIPGMKYDPTLPPLRVMPLNYRITSATAKVLHERFPGWIFTSIGSGDHDHPIAHTTNLVNAFQMTSEFRRNKVYLDLHGNPSANETLNVDANLQVKTLVSLESAKDYLRKSQKWGPEMVNGRRRYYNCSLRDVTTTHADMVEEVDEVVSFHTLYYYEKREIARLLAQTKGGVMTALIHRFKGEEGHLNGNEQCWRKERVGDRARVIQTNALTGEQYSHRDMEDWFQGENFWGPYGSDIVTKSQATQDALESLSWTVNKASDDVFRITIAVVPNSVARLVSTVKETALTQLQDSNVVEVALNGHTTTYSIRPELQEIFEEMRGRVLLAPRNQEKLHAHAQMTHIKFKQWRDKTKGVAHASEELDVCLASYWVDYEKQAALTPSLVSKSALMVAAQAKLMSGKGIGSAGGCVKKSMLMMADALSSSSTKATFAQLFRGLADEI